jgi:hypothetical protein
MDFFRSTVQSIMQNKKFRIHETTEFYVVNLLTQAVRAHTGTKESGNLQEPLAILFGKAYSTTNQNEKYQLLKHLGDQSLYVSGFFSDSLNRKVVDIDYYISMGSHAYGELSGISKKTSSNDFFTKVFGEMAEKFTGLVDMISEVSEKANITNNLDVLRVYERWLYTKSHRLLKMLKEQGIDPIKCAKEMH